MYVEVAELDNFLLNPEIPLEEKIEALSRNYSLLSPEKFVKLGEPLLKAIKNDPEKYRDLIPRLERQIAGKNSL